MQFIMFTKHLEGLDLAQIIEALHSVGVQGADLCVRPGYPVNPDNAASALPAAACQFAEAGLSIPLVTVATSLNQPVHADAAPLYAACAEAGVQHIKIGYWRWSSGQSYAAALADARNHLAGFAQLSQQHGVQTVVHTHSGAYLGLNASAALQLVEGFDPQHVGIFADTGHLSVCGEPIDMALHMVRDYLAVVSFKDLARIRTLQEGRTQWQTEVVRMGRGFVDWPTALHTLRAIDYAGPVSFHSEYSGEPPASVIDLARCDVRFVQRLLATW